MNLNLLINWEHFALVLQSDSIIAKLIEPYEIVMPSFLDSSFPQIATAFPSYVLTVVQFV